MDGGLPYDDSAMDEDVPVSAPAAVAPETTEHPMLDRALDDFGPRGPRFHAKDADTDKDYNAYDAEFAQYATVPTTAMGAMFGAPPTTSRERGVVPDHIANLLGRMSRNKVYLAEESDGIIHHDAEARLRGDPRLARLAAELDSQDPTSWLEAISEHASVRIRSNALYVSSELIKHLSTAKVFTWASQAGATAMGIEWLNDSTLILLFATPAATLLGLSMLAKAGFDPTEGDDPLLERAAHGIPPSLLPQVEAPEPKADKEKEEKDEPMEPADGVRRRGRGAFGTLASDEQPSGSARGAFDLEPLAPSAAPTFAEGVDPHARVTIRYATDADHVARRGARDSEWYARHGRGAGKEVSRRNFSAGTGYGALGAELKDRVGTAGEGREFARRLGRQMERSERGPYARRERERRSAGDLDAELDRMAAGRAAGEDMLPLAERERERGAERGARRGRGRGRRDGREGREGRDGRGASNRDDLDRELDEMFAARGSG